MKIPKFDIHSLRNNRHYQFDTEFRDLVVKAGADKLKIDVQFAVNS